MLKKIELPEGVRVMVEVDLRYWRGRLEPFQFLFRGERYFISRITRRRKKTYDHGEMRHYWIKVENLRGSYELVEEIRTALWTIKRSEQLKKV